MRRLPPPAKKPSGLIVGVAVIVSIAFSVLMFAGIARVALWVGGIGDLLSIRETLGIGVGVFLYRVVDRVFDRRTQETEE